MNYNRLLYIPFLVLLYSSNTFAQNVAPTISDPADLEQIQQEKEEVFKQLFQDPTNLNLLFKYANLSILVGDLEAAIGVFEQMLIYESDLPRIRLELGVLYFRLGAFALAKSYLNSVKEYDPPAEVLAKVELFLSEIEEAQEPFQVNHVVSLGVKHTSNGNNGINADFIDIGDFLLSVDPDSKRDSDQSRVMNYSLTINHDLNHPRGDSVQYFFAVGSDRFREYSKFDIQSNVISARRIFNLDENYFTFIDLDDASFIPNLNLLRVTMNREEILRSYRLGLDYSGILTNGSSVLFSYYRDQKDFRSSIQKNGRLNGVSFGQSFNVPAINSMVNYKVSLENYRAQALYEFYENYLFEVGLSKTLNNNWLFNSKYTYFRKSHDDPYPLFGMRNDRFSSIKFNFSKQLNACWSTSMNLNFSDSRSTINIYKRSANQLSAQLSYLCFG